MPENTTNLTGVTDDIVDWGNTRLRSVDERARRSIQERPLLYVAGAFVIGCLIGRVVSRL